MACARPSGAPESVTTTPPPNRSSPPSRKKSSIYTRGRHLRTCTPPCLNTSSRTTTAVDPTRQSVTTPRSNTNRNTHSRGYRPHKPSVFKIGNTPHVLGEHMAPRDDGDDD